MDILKEERARKIRDEREKLEFTKRADDLEREKGLNKNGWDASW